MASFRHRLLRKFGVSTAPDTAAAFDDLRGRLEGLEASLLHVRHLAEVTNHAVTELQGAVEQNRLETLAARHEAMVLLTTDIDAANEATALLGRAIADHRADTEQRLGEIVDRLPVPGQVADASS